MEHEVYSGVTALWQIVKSSIIKGWWKSWMKWLGSILVSGEVMASYQKGRDLKRGVWDEWRAGQMMFRLKWTDGREGKVIDEDISKFLPSFCETCGEYTIDCFTDYKTCLIMQAEYKKRKKHYYKSQVSIMHLSGSDSENVILYIKIVQVYLQR